MKNWSFKSPNKLKKLKEKWSDEKYFKIMPTRTRTKAYIFVVLPKWSNPKFLLQKLHVTHRVSTVEL